jgi:hypothetical protein
MLLEKRHRLKLLVNLPSLDIIDREMLCAATMPV